jgi:ribosomal protein S19E (S16A)
MNLLTDTQIAWLGLLYTANVRGRAATTVPQRMFDTLKEFGYVAGDAAGASITPDGAGILLKYRQDAEKLARATRKGNKRVH